jgi:hypothetical protein
MELRVADCTAGTFPSATANPSDRPTKIYEKAPVSFLTEALAFLL